MVQAGLDGIEWGGDVHVPHGDLRRAREVRDMTRSEAIRIASYGSYYRVGDRAPTSFEKVLDTAVELGAPLIRVWAGKQGSMIVALVVGILAFLMHRGQHLRGFSKPSMDLAPARHDMRDLDHAVDVSHALRRNLHRTIQEADGVHDHPGQAGDVLYQIKRMLPAEGYLTKRMALLQARAHCMRKGQIAEIEETRDMLKDLPPQDRKRISGELAARYAELGLDKRIEKLEAWAAENETKIRDLTRDAEQYLVQYDYRRLHDCLKAAEILQKRNSRIFQLIERTEKRLLVLSKQIAKGAGAVKVS